MQDWEKRKKDRTRQSQITGLPKGAPRKTARALQQQTWQSQITGLPKGASRKTARALQQQTWQSQITGLPKGASRKTARELAQKAYQTKCGILDAMYPLQKYARDRMRIKKKLNEMSPDERIKYLCEHRAKTNERRYTQIHGAGSKSESTGPIFLEEDTQNHNTADTIDKAVNLLWTCLLYTSPSPRD